MEQIYEYLTDAKKITANWEMYGNYRSWGLVQIYCLTNSAHSESVGISLSLNNNGSSYQNSGFWTPSSTIASITQANPTGTYSFTMSMNLETGEISGGYTGPSSFSGSGTLTAEDIAKIKTFSEIYFDIRGQSYNYNRSRKLYVKIEY